MGIEIEINVEGPEEQKTPEQIAQEEAAKKTELAALWAEMKDLVNGKSSLSASELEIAKGELAKKIAECMDPEKD